MRADAAPQPLSVAPEERLALAGHDSFCLWFTGLSGAGKSTLANLVDRRLHERGAHSFLLDGDSIRRGLCSDLGFGESDRRENVRRAAEAARLFTDAGVVAIAALISPFRADREGARRVFAPGRFVEVYVRCPLDVCMTRDPKGLYRRARQGLIADFTGVSSPYEEPLSPDVVVDTALMPPDACAGAILAHLERAFRLPAAPAVRRQAADGR